ncbi:hypothetical protein NDN08_003114 [Rhodosorus marinus]|uniref:Uncharacterized protein n=1 Tax=Rhodosorus marinus TaxID=101924 RepID=A0AAV8UVK6_9RHOD|nr:hypothetical protein NDN08_003114 [Rhodosorus marinus]
MRVEPGPMRGELVHVIGLGLPSCDPDERNSLSQRRLYVSATSVVMRVKGVCTPVPVPGRDAVMVSCGRSFHSLKSQHPYRSSEPMRVKGVRTPSPV